MRNAPLVAILISVVGSVGAHAQHQAMTVAGAWRLVDTLRTPALRVPCSGAVQLRFEQTGDVMTGTATHVMRSCQDTLSDLAATDGRVHGDSVRFSLGSCQYRGRLSDDWRVASGTTDCNVPVGTNAIVLRGAWFATRIELEPTLRSAPRSLPNRSIGNDGPRNRVWRSQTVKLRVNRRHDHAAAKIADGSGNGQSDRE